MNEIITISNVRCYLDNNQTVWLNLEDVSKGLGFTQTKYGVEYVRWERVHRYLKELEFPICGEKEPYIPENVFYRLAMKANNEIANKFQEKIANEILPSIRKYGGYITNQENMTPEQLIANALVVANNIIENQKKQLDEAKPKIEFYDQVTQSEDLLDIKQVASILGLGYGRNTLFAKLRDLNILDQYNMPYQKYIDQKYFKVVEVKKETINEIRVFAKTCVYQKGLDFIRKKVCE